MGHYFGLFIFKDLSKSVVSLFTVYTMHPFIINMGGWYLETPHLKRGFRILISNATLPTAPNNHQARVMWKRPLSSWRKNSPILRVCGLVWLRGAHNHNPTFPGQPGCMLRSGSGINFWGVHVFFTIFVWGSPVKFVPDVRIFMKKMAFFNTAYL